MDVTTFFVVAGIFLVLGILIGIKIVPREKIPAFEECEHCMEPVRIGASICPTCKRSVGR